MSKRNPFKIREQVIEQLELPRDFLLGEVILTVTGRRELLIENYKGILIYEDSFIKIQAKNCRLILTGRKLSIDYYTNEEMKISGYIEQIQYE
ncbi:MAG: YabP/YqfC family sporulation protein [Roseburia sp.]|nr:YabP/YqfC family sporulation protein [Roseburia sp.]